MFCFVSSLLGETKRLEKAGMGYFPPTRLAGVVKSQMLRVYNKIVPLEGRPLLTRMECSDSLCRSYLFCPLLKHAVFFPDLHCENVAQFLGINPQK